MEFQALGGRLGEGHRDRIRNLPIPLVPDPVKQNPTGKVRIAAHFSIDNARNLPLRRFMPCRQTPDGDLRRSRRCEQASNRGRSS
jgi:hypothetical protein